MSALRRTATATALWAGLALTAGCQSNGDGEAQPLPPAESSSTTPTETTSPNPSETPQPAWQDKYSKKEIAAYEAALDRFATYEQRSEPIWRRGKATPAAEELFKEYFPSPMWQGEVERLRTYENNDVTVTGVPTVYWSKPTRIAKNALSVDILQCVDFSDVVTEQHDQQVEGNKWTTTPHLRALSLAKPEGYDWLIYSYGDTEGKKKPCEP